jgi:hypothetical protein
MCTMRVSRCIFEHRTTSSSMMAKPTPACGWRITILHVGRAGRTTTPSSSSFSPFTWPTRPGPGSTTFLGTQLIAGRTEEVNEYIFVYVDGRAERTVARIYLWSIHDYLAYDWHLKCQFNLCGVYLWSINDYLAYDKFDSWCVHS